MSKPPVGYVCHTCDVPGHYRSDCPKGDGNWDTYCGCGRGRGSSRGAGRSYIPRPLDLPADDWALAAQERSGYTAEEIAGARAFIDAVTRGDISQFLVDSSASKHMCKDKELFTTMTPTKAVVLGDGSTLTEKGMLICRIYGV